MKNLKGKKLLIIGGAFQHCKVVEAAKRHGVITYVIDYLPYEKAPAKRIADFHYEIDINYINKIIEICKKENIDGVLASHLDACQIPYCKVCNELNYPCFGTPEQFDILTKKDKFIDFCKSVGVDVIPQYDEDSNIDYPVFVKPTDSRGSRGQSICYNEKEFKEALIFAKNESKSKKIIIEKYMKDKPDFSMTYFVIDSHPYLIRLCDRYEGKKEDGLDKLCQGCISPSIYTDLYVKNVDEKVKKLIVDLGIKNGPVFMQGFIDGDTVRMYDPGLRFPGGEYERLFAKTTGVDLCDLLVEFALTGKISEENLLKNDCFLLNNNYAIQIDLSLKPGLIKQIDGLDILSKDEHTCAVAQRYFVGDTISKTHDVRQRLCEIAFTVNKNENFKEIINHFINCVSVKDAHGDEMVVSRISLDKLIKE